MVVYIDVLFVLNLIINYFLLLAVSQLLHRSDKRLRIFAGAALGAFYASLMFFPLLGLLYTTLLKFIFSITIVAVSFKSSSLKNFLKLLAFFYVISMLFGGVIVAVEYFLAPPALLVKNGVAYMNVSPLFLILSSAGCYIIIKLFSRIFHRDVHTEDIYKATVEIGDNSVTLMALLDNGNDLCDTISGSPVIIAEYSKIEPLIPAELQSVFRTGRLIDTAALDATGFSRRFRIVPYGSVGNTGGILPAFRPDRLIVANAGVETGNVLIAVTNRRLSDDGLFFMLLNPRLFGSEKHSEFKPANCAAGIKSQSDAYEK